MDENNQGEGGGKRGIKVEITFSGAENGGKEGRKEGTGLIW